MNVFVCGYPGEIGGANTELWHTVKLWRGGGLDVTMIPTWKADPMWHERLANIGCRTVESEPGRLDRVPGLAGGTLVSMCNTKFLAAAEAFRRLDCRIVWLGCMNWLFPEERLHYRKCGPFDRHVFQTRYQQEQLTPQLRRLGFRESQGCVIHGALDLEEFPFRPLAHGEGEVFTVGRISRAAADKFSPRTWAIHAKVPHPLRVRVLGWAAEVEARLGPPPRWAECFPPGSQSPQAFLAGLHAMVHAGAAAVENWPRVGLEAMAAGVAVVADDRGGWSEMIRHGQTGYLCGSDDELAYYTARLAYDRQHRLEMIHRARHVLETELADPHAIWRQWKQLLEDLS